MAAPRQEVFLPVLRNWCSGNIPSFQVGVTGSNPVFRFLFLRHMDPVEILLLLSDLEGSAANCRKLGFVEDSLVLDEMKKRYYKLYFKLKKEQSNPL